MASTPPRSKLSLSKNTKKETVSTLMSTPKNNQKFPSDQDDYSPVYFPSTQEASEDIDVLWDWHSPQTGERRRKKQKRALPLHQSPKFPIKRYPSNSQNFEKLHDELKALKEELALPDDESILCLSPQQEMEYKEGENRLKTEPEHHVDELMDDLFNDSIDEQLVLFSQQIENQLENKGNDSRDFADIGDSSEIDKLIEKYTSGKTDKFKNLTTNESSTVPQPLKTTTIPIHRTVSDTQMKANVIETISGKLELHRTKSFELEAVRNNEMILSKSTLEEIERKRQEARARLAAKRKQENPTCLYTQNPATQCTPEEIEKKRLQALAIREAKCSFEEIEKKRLQALAKREAKRLQEIVEKNRQEALKRLQISRSKNANLVKSALSNRLIH